MSLGLGLSNKDLLTWCDDLHNLKGSVSQFQSSLNTILTKAPTSIDFQLLDKEINSNINSPIHQQQSPIIEKTKSLLSTPQAKVGVKLKELYSNDLLPFLALLNKVNFKSPKSDKWVAYLNDYVPPKGIGKESLKFIKKDGKDKTTGSKTVKSATSVYPPSLLPIEDSKLLSLVLTDKSFRQPSDFIESSSLDDFSNKHNAKLATKGRKVLEHALLEILDEKFPNIQENDLALLQFKLINPTILTKFSFGYDLVNYLKYSISVDGVSIKDKMNIIGNVFLAYIGALTSKSKASPEFSYTFEDIKIWISKLYNPVIEEIYETIKSNGLFSKPLEGLAKSELDYLFGSKINYKVIEIDSIFVVEVRIGDQLVGTGTSSKSAEDGKIKAAQETFNNKSLLDEILIKEENERKEKVVVQQGHTNGDTEMATGEEEYEPSFEPEEIPTEQVATNQKGERAAVNQYGAPPPLPGREAADTQDSIQSSTKATFAKKNLHSILGKHGLVPIYKYSKHNKEHMVTIMVDDVILARASAINKKIASQNAALTAMGNKETLEALFTKAETPSSASSVRTDNGDNMEKTSRIIKSPTPNGLPNLPPIPPRSTF
ncbi:hypothetical protein CLIB1423_02S10132 [[Candida] railenensis]|uniref:RNase III domain-containing protein n=1 Tax=[Candida] railenensis TaxID=45579 RepID=A0A9P0QMA0_9ASCO|nr:hypothetical protein CLIB1423_02S10132 [[Candida] railenensis]